MSYQAIVARQYPLLKYSCKSGLLSWFANQCSNAPQPLPAAGWSLEADAVNSPLSATLVPRCVLVVDDNRDAADSLKLLLELLGAEVHVVNNGPDALQALEAFRPVVVLLDIGIPGMDGNEVARRIRQHPIFADVTLIALSGWGQAEDRQRSQEAGFDHHLIKPADLDSLKALLFSVDDRANHRPAEPLRETTGPSR